MRRTAKTLAIQRVTLRQLGDAAGAIFRNSFHACSESCNSCRDYTICCYDDTSPESQLCTQQAY
jgi:hypothetical protein